MGLLIDGTWHNQWYDTAVTKGKFQRGGAQLRNWIAVQGTYRPRWV